MSVRKIEGYDRYYVSDDGDVFTSFGCPEGEMKKMFIEYTHDGYPKVGLYTKGVRQWKRVHHLVLEAFVGPRPPGQVARHLNDIPKDARLSNLAWGTEGDNWRDYLVNRGLSPDFVTWLKYARPALLEQLSREFGCFRNSLQAAEAVQQVTPAEAGVLGSH